MICNESCNYFVDNERAYCSISGLTVNEDMKCFEDIDSYNDSDSDNDIDEDDEES